jgi:hypothetical protein
MAREEWKEPFLYLKVRVSNDVALAMYSKMGYLMASDEEWTPSFDPITREKIILLEKSLLA